MARKLEEPIDPGTIHYTKLMPIVRLTSQPEFDRLANSGIFVRARQRAYYELFPSVGNYIEYLRGIAARHKTDGYDVVKENALLKQSQRSLAELKAARLRGDLVSRAEIFPLWAEAVKDFRAIVLSMPARAQAALPHLVPSEVEALKRTAREALNEFKVKGEHPPETPAPDERR